MHQPYTYLIKHIPTGKVYYGLRFAKGCHPGDLWVKYFTSSKDVQAMIAEYGKDSFTTEIRKVFIDPAAAVKWEITVLRRMKVLGRPDFINRNIPGTTVRFVLSDETKQKMRKPKPEGFAEKLKGNKHATVTKGVPKTKEHAKNISKGKKGKAPFSGKDHPRYGKKKSDEELQKISLSMKKKKWMNNGINCAFIEPDAIGNYLARGYTMGRGSLKFKKET